MLSTTEDLERIYRALHVGCGGVDRGPRPKDSRIIYAGLDTCFPGCWVIRPVECDTVRSVWV